MGVLFEGKGRELGIGDQVVGVGVEGVNVILFVVALVEVEVEDVDQKDAIVVLVEDPAELGLGLDELAVTG